MDRSASRPSSMFRTCSILASYHSPSVRPAEYLEYQQRGHRADRKLYFSGLTGGHSATSVLGLDKVVSMDPEQEIPLVFACWEQWLREAGICDSIADVDFLEIHAFGAQPKSPNPLADPLGYAQE